VSEVLLPIVKHSRSTSGTCTRLSPHANSKMPVVRRIGNIMFASIWRCCPPPGPRYLPRPRVVRPRLPPRICCPSDWSAFTSHSLPPERARACSVTRSDVEIDMTYLERDRRIEAPPRRWTSLREGILDPLCSIVPRRPLAIPFLRLDRGARRPCPHLTDGPLRSFSPVEEWRSTGSS